MLPASTPLHSSSTPVPVRLFALMAAAFAATAFVLHNEATIQSIESKPKPTYASIRP
jgi:hypothetical protein